MSPPAASRPAATPSVERVFRALADASGLSCCARPVRGAGVLGLAPRARRWSAVPQRVREAAGERKAMNRVIFACVHNAGRSQMAAAFFNQLADPKSARAISAGTEPGNHVHPQVVEVMKEMGIDLSSAKPQKLTDALTADANFLITMGCGEACPFVPGLQR